MSSKLKMACLVPFLPYDVKWFIAELKYKIETENYDAFVEDFVVDIISHEEKMSDEEDDFYFPIVSEMYNLKVTYKPTGLYMIIPFVLTRCSNTSTFDVHTIRKRVIKDIHKTTYNYKRGGWKRTKDANGTWYYSEKLRIGNVLDETYQEWEKLIQQLQCVMMNRFERFIEVE